MTLTYACVCSGISAATVAWSPLGFRPRWFSEIHPFACSVLAHHYPEVPNRGDVLRISDPEPVELLVAGSPCQPFSVTGKRGGMADARGGLALDAVRLARRAGARWFVWENVPGVVSSAGGADFRAVVAEAVRLGYGVAWRVLDARAFGLPQARRRLFLVGRAGGRVERAAAVLADRPAPAAAPGAIDEVQQVDPAGSGRGPVWGWTGDETPKFVRDASPTLRSSQGGEGVGMLVGGRLRKFLPVELERLQGLPDGYTDVPHNGRPASDRRRLFVIGNAFPVPVVRWIGEGIRAVEERWPSETSG